MGSLAYETGIVEFIFDRISNFQMHRLGAFCTAGELHDKELLHDERLHNKGFLHRGLWPLGHENGVAGLLTAPPDFAACLPGGFARRRGANHTADP